MEVDVLSLTKAMPIPKKTKVLLGINLVFLVIMQLLNSYKKKNIALLVAAIVFIGLIYKINIQKTLRYINLYNTQKAKLTLAKNAPSDIQKYKVELELLQQSTQKTYNREYLLEQLTRFCKEHDLLVKSFAKEHRIVKDDLPVITNEIEVEGTYHAIVKLIYMLEYEEKLGSVSSSDFYRKRDVQKRKDFLRTKLVLRSIENNEK